MNGLISSCNGGLMATTLDDHERGKAGGWYNAGNLGGGGDRRRPDLSTWPIMSPKPTVALTLAATMIIAVAGGTR